jgi:hypothetical protein
MAKKGNGKIVNAGNGRTLRKRQGSWTKKNRMAFCTLLSIGMTVVDACEEVGLSQSSVYELRDRDEEFMAMMQEAYDDSTRLLEGECFRRAKGWEETIIQRDGSTRVMEKYDNLLLMFLLKARKPRMYRETMDININEKRHILIDLVQVVKDENTGRLMLIDEEQPPLLASGGGDDG